MKVKIIDPAGLHARPASVVAKKAAEFESTVEFHYNGKSANAASMMSVMSLGVTTGEEVEIKATGSDADEAVQAVKASMKENGLI